MWTHMISRLLVEDRSEFYREKKRDNFVKQRIERRLMTDSCTVQDHKMSVLYVLLVTQIAY
jgi:hypothetical protein